MVRYDGGMSQQLGLEMTTYDLDQHGHLADRNQWSRSVATALAAEDGIKLSADHWQLIEHIQALYEQTGDTPPMRLLIKVLKQNWNQDIDSRFLYRLYPDGPIRLASRHAGLPKPKHCM